VSAPEAVTRAWDEVVAHWDEQARHDTLLGLIAQHSCYAWAAGKYKERGGDPIADQQLVRLRKAATATMLATAAARPDKTGVPFKGSLLVLAVVAILTGVGLVYLQFRHQNAAVTRTGAP
jgi:hypothetical protein